MGKIPFNVSSNTARLIGRENIANLEGALIELVKNTYDADASICIVYYEQSTDSIWIIDNGTGMTEDVLIHNWMTIGNSSKKKEFTTRSGRIQTGEKGIGRFALDKIAKECWMHTISYKSNFVWEIDWDLFENNDLITDVYAEIDHTDTSLAEIEKCINNSQIKTILRDSFIQTGTAFHLKGLRDEWNVATIKKMRNALSRLLPPDEQKNYKIYFFEEDTNIQNAEIESAFVDSYDYKVDFSLKNDICEICIHRNEFDFGDVFNTVMKRAGFSQDDINYFKGKKIHIIKSIAELLPGVEHTNLGDISGSIYFYKLSSQEKDKERFFYKEFSNRGSRYKDVSGIKIYRDHFLVRPYGIIDSTGYDWLELSTRKAESPAGIASPKGIWKVQTNQMSGQIYISRLNKALPDKSSRDGIVETLEFDQFKELIISIITSYPGIVTAANDFFVLNKTEVQKRSLTNIVDPIILKSNDVGLKLFLNEGDFNSIVNKNKKSYILNLAKMKYKEFPSGLKRYLREGKQKKINERYKCQKRNRWYDMRMGEKGELFFFKRYHEIPRFVLNRADIYSTDIAYNVITNKNIEAEASCFSFYNSLTLTMCEFNGRFYGGGVCELTPSEFKDLSIPYYQAIHKEVMELDDLMRQNVDVEEIIKYVDGKVLGVYLGEDEIIRLGNIRKKLMHRRLSN